jgi:hypothetical protein
MGRSCSMNERIGMHIGCLWEIQDRLYGLVGRVSGYRSRGPDSIPDSIRFSEMQWVWNGVNSAS